MTLVSTMGEVRGTPRQGRLALFSMAGTGAMCAHVALEEIEAPYDVIYLVPGAAKDALLALNPLGKVPTLVLSDGEVLTQNSVVLTYIADMRPGRLLATEPVKRREALQWVGHFNSDVQYSLRLFGMPARFCEAPDSLARCFGAALDGFFQNIEKRLSHRPWLTGEQFTLADIYCGCVFTWARRFAFSLDRYSVGREFFERFERRDSVRRVREFELTAQAAR
jgi:glutathione S-transferase